MPWRSRIRELLKPTTVWRPVALNDPQDVIVVRFVSDEVALDVTSCNAIASLKPLSVAIGCEKRSGLPDNGTMEFWDKVSGELLGSLLLTRIKIAPISRTEIFAVDSGHHRCVPALRRTWEAIVRHATERKRSADPYNFAMSKGAAARLMIFYICPRPVFLVTVGEQDRCNIFPMDLVGPTSEELFTLALRSSNRSIGAMKSSRQVALSGVRARDKGVAYALGAQHGSDSVDLSALPFSTQASRLFGLPVSSIATRIMEFEIKDIAEIGTHTFFVCKQVSDEHLCKEGQLFHTTGFHERFQKVRGRPFLPA
jgi:flavin reductase (DIM6/NTAB) family NADH-FMN oxidoreductase RutF